MRQVFATVLVEPNVLLREGLARIFSARPFRMLYSAASINDSILSRLSHRRSVLLVIGAGDDPDATAMQIALFKEKQPSGQVAVLANHYQSSAVLSAFRAGANAYFVKITTCAAFIKSLELVMLGETIVPREFLSFILRGDAIDPEVDVKAGADGAALAIVHSKDACRLSTQEQRILRYLVDGSSNKVIARKIDIAEATVKVHIKAILRKIRVHNRTQAAVWAINNNSYFETITKCSNDLLGIADPLGPPDELDPVPLTNVRLFRKYTGKPASGGAIAGHGGGA
jgi:two-component system, NarL family, nitrate/nitrite response regulator NarL